MFQNVRTVLRSDELSCPSCVPKIEKARRGLPGVDKAEVRFNTGKIEVEHDPDRTSVEALRGTGYEAQPSAFGVRAPPLGAHRHRQ